MNLDAAQRMNEHLIEIVKHANEVLSIANNSGDYVIKNKTQMVLASAIADIDMQLWELIYSQHPVLRPTDMIPIGQMNY